MPLGLHSGGYVHAGDGYTAHRLRIHTYPASTNKAYPEPFRSTPTIYPSRPDSEGHLQEVQTPIRPWLREMDGSGWILALRFRGREVGASGMLNLGVLTRKSLSYLHTYLPITNALTRNSYDTQQPPHRALRRRVSLSTHWEVVVDENTRGFGTPLKKETAQLDHVLAAREIGASLLATSMPRHAISECGDHHTWLNARNVRVKTTPTSKVESQVTVYDAECRWNSQSALVPLYLMPYILQLLLVLPRNRNSLSSPPIEFSPVYLVRLRDCPPSKSWRFPQALSVL